MKEVLLWIDQFWCASSLMHAKELCAFANPKQNPLNLAILRLFSVIALLCELLGIFLLVHGAISHQPEVFALGVAIKVIGYLSAGLFHNQSGIFLHLWWTEHLTAFRQYQKEFNGILSQLGLVAVK